MAASAISASNSSASDEHNHLDELPGIMAEIRDEPEHPTAFKFEIVVPKRLHPQTRKELFVAQNEVLRYLLEQSCHQMEKDYALKKLMDNENERLRKKLFNKQHKPQKKERTGFARHMTSEKNLESLRLEDWAAVFKQMAKNLLYKATRSAMDQVQKERDAEEVAQIKEAAKIAKELEKRAERDAKALEKEQERQEREKSKETQKQAKEREKARTTDERKRARERSQMAKETTKLLKAAEAAAAKAKKFALAQSRKKAGGRTKKRKSPTPEPSDNDSDDGASDHNQPPTPLPTKARPRPRPLFTGGKVLNSIEGVGGVEVQPSERVEAIAGGSNLGMNKGEGDCDVGLSRVEVPDVDEALPILGVAEPSVPVRRSKRNRV